MLASYKVGGTAAIVCAISYIFGILTFQFLAPGLYDIPEGHLAVFEQFGWWLYVWYFIVFVVVGFCVVFTNHALLKPFDKLPSGVTMFITLTAYLGASYTFIIFAIQMFSHVFLLAEHNLSGFERSQLTTQIYSVLTQLRSYTEWTIDLWLFLISALLLKTQQLNRILGLLGMSTAILGVLILNPNFFDYVTLYVWSISIWFFAIGVQLLRQKLGKPAIL